MKKRLFICLSAILLFTLLAGCDALCLLQNAGGVSMETPFIGFRPDHPQEIDLKGYTRVEESVFADYKSGSAAYSSTVYYDTLSQNDRMIYRIFQYAMDHAQPCILIDNRVLANTDSTLEDILYFFALDSALVEQNLDWETSEVGITTTRPQLFQASLEEKYDARQLYIGDFSQEKQSKKNQAIQVAQGILGEMPENLTDTQKAEYFYRYLGEHVQYFLEDDREETADYLYDALCVGKTNCDGFANAYSLLCSMAGINCLEKLYVPEDGSVGHTWNAVCLDGVWYNVDATGSDEVRDETYALSRFGFSDSLLEHQYEYADRLPACETDLIPADCTVNNTSQAGKLIKNAYNAVKKNTDRNYVIALFPGGEVGSKVMQNVANALNRDITAQHYVTMDGVAVYYIFPED